MLYAIDSRTGRQVHAEDGARHRTYECPVCRGGVFLRSGQQHAPHFAHRHETAKPECELYTPGESQFDPHRVPPRPFLDDNRAGKDTLRIPPPEVCIEVEDHQLNRNRQLPRWKLCVTIPKSVDGRGTIIFDFGAASRRIALSKLFSGAATYPADPDATDFKAIWCSPETNSVYQEIVKQEQSGLNKRGMTPFVTVPGRYKPRARRLVCGRTYYFVWPKSFDPKFPSDFEILTFENNQDWSCILGSLPKSRDELLAEWLESVCSVDVENSSSTWSLLYPFLSTYTYDGCIEVPSVGSLILGCNRTEAAGGAKTKVSSTINGECIGLPLPDQLRSIVTLTYSNDPPDVFELSGDYQVSFSFRQLDPQELTEQPIAWGEFELPTEGSIRVPMHTAAARRWLGEVREDRAQLKQITLPKAVQVELAWRSEPIAPWNRSLLNRRNGQDRKWLHQVRLTRKELDQIQTILRLTSNEVRIAFQGFGEHHFLEVEKDENHTISLSRRLRNRMLWLQKEISLIHGIGQPVTENISDHDLVQRFLVLTPPPSLVGHYQAISRSVEELVSTRGRGGVG